MDIKYSKMFNLIKYISKMEHKLTSERRTQEESDVDFVILKEHFRRILVFMEYTSIEVREPLWFDAIRLSGINFICDTEKVCPALKDIKYQYMRSISDICIKWIMLAENGNEIACKFFDIYEPLLLYHAIGGCFRKENGFLDVGLYSFYLADWKTIASDIEVDIYMEAYKVWKQPDWF